MTCFLLCALMASMLIGVDPLPLVAQQLPSERPFWRPVVMGTYGMVAAEHPLEVVAGTDILRAGGHAFDAATAVFYMTTVVEQHQAGMGGDAFILAYLAADAQRSRGRAPTRGCARPRPPARP